MINYGALYGFLNLENLCILLIEINSTLKYIIENAWASNWSWKMYRALPG